MEPTSSFGLTQEQATEYLGQLLHTIPVGVVTVDAQGTVRAFNEAAGELLAAKGDGSPEAVVGVQVATLFEEPEEIARIISHSLAGEPQSVTLECRTSNGLRHVEVVAHRVSIGTEDSVGLLVLQDVTKRMVVERELKRAVLDREFLTQSGSELSKSLDYQATLESLVRLAISYLADWCTVNMTEEDGTITRSTVAHVDPAREPLMAELHEAGPHESEADTAVARVLRTGAAELHAVVGRELERTMSADRLRIASELGMESCMIVPLVAHGEVMGTLSLVSSRPDHHYDEADLELAGELALRAGLALFNARLFQTVEDARARSANMARILQRSLLPPELPKIPGLEVAALYRPATESLEVGGDFYDLFETTGGEWGLVMGDVQGHGAKAAATTALARYTLRAIASRLPRPVHVLYQVNKALLKQQEERFLSAVYATMSPGSSTSVTIACAGHPKPMIIRSDGRVDSAGGDGMLLGLFSAPDLNEQVVELAPGDALVLYTDGLTEAGAPRNLLGEEGLRQVLSRCAGMTASDICRSIDEVLLTWQSEKGHRDDCAALVLRVVPERERLTEREGTLL